MGQSSSCTVSTQYSETCECLSLLPILEYLCFLSDISIFYTFRKLLRGPPSWVKHHWRHLQTFSEAMPFQPSHRSKQELTSDQRPRSISTETLLKHGVSFLKSNIVFIVHRWVWEEEICYPWHGFNSEGYHHCRVRALHPSSGATKYVREKRERLCKDHTKKDEKEAKQKVDKCPKRIDKGKRKNEEPQKSRKLSYSSSASEKFNTIVAHAVFLLQSRWRLQ